MLVFALPVEDIVGDKEHVKTPFIALTGIPKTRQLPRQTTKASTRNKHVDIFWITINNKKTS